MWRRDRAEDLKRASLDRINSNGNYEAGNVRFIEFALNSRMAWDPRARIPAAERDPTDMTDVPEAWQEWQRENGYL